MLPHVVLIAVNLLLGLEIVFKVFLYKYSRQLSLLQAYRPSYYLLFYHGKR